MSIDGFDKTVTEQNGPELMKFAYHILLYYFERTPALAEEKKLQRRLAMWLRDKYQKNMVDPNAPLSDAKFILNERLSIPSKDKISEIVGLYNVPINRESVIYVSSRLVKALWLDTNGSELPDNYFIEERTLSLSVEYGGGDTHVNFSVYRQRSDGSFEKIAENLRGEKQNGINTFIAQFHYRRERERGRQESVNLYFRAYKNNAAQTESVVRPFVDGIVAIETERNWQRKFFEFSDPQPHPYGGFQGWYKQGDLFTNDTDFRRKKGASMDGSGCGPIAATNVIYHYAQQFNASFAKRRFPDGFQDTPVIPTRKEYIHMAVDVYNSYTMQTVPGLPLGIWFIDPLCNGIVRFAQDRGVSLKKHTLTNKVLASKNSFRQAVDFIIEGLKNNYPVILLVTANNYIISARHKSTPVQGNRMVQFHIVAVTAMKRTAENEEDYELAISNWSERSTIPSLKQMWEGTNIMFDGTQVATAAAVAKTALKKTGAETPAMSDGLQIAATVAAAAAPLTLRFASVSLGYCSFR